MLWVHTQILHRILCALRKRNKHGLVVRQRMPFQTATLVRLSTPLGS